MTDTELERLQYPRGRLRFQQDAGAAEIDGWVSELESLPQQLRAAVDGLSEQQLDTPYRPGGWTVRQVLHHVPDSHLNAYLRTNWILTEATPTIKPYDQDAWAELPYYKTAPVGNSLDLLETVHRRWTPILRALSAAQWQRKFRHPEHERELSLTDHLQIYAWHSRHHLAHVTELRQRMKW